MLGLIPFPALGCNIGVLLEAFKGRPGATAKLSAGGSGGRRVSSCGWHFHVIHACEGIEQGAGNKRITPHCNLATWGRRSVMRMYVCMLDVKDVCG